MGPEPSPLSLRHPSYHDNRRALIEKKRNKNRWSRDRWQHFNYFSQAWKMPSKCLIWAGGLEGLLREVSTEGLRLLFEGLAPLTDRRCNAKARGKNTGTRFLGGGLESELYFLNTIWSLKFVAWKSKAKKNVEHRLIMLKQNIHQIGYLEILSGTEEVYPWLST